MFLEKNIQALMQANPTQANLLHTFIQNNPVPPDGVQLVETPAGDFSLRYRDCFLHDPGGASREAEAIALKDCKPGAGRTHLILGVGLGYLLEAVYMQSPGGIVIYEPQIGLLNFAFENVDLSEMLGSGRVQWVVSQQALLNTLSPLLNFNDSLDILITPGYASLMASDIPELMRQLFLLVDERVRDYQTGRHFHLQWTKQFFQNLPSFLVTQPLEAVASELYEKPALVIGRGPSLDHSLEAMRSVSGSMVLIAVGGALRRLWEAGITPDFAVFYDANGMAEQLYGLPDAFLSNIIFLLSPFTQACCFSASAKAKVLMFPQSGEAFANWWDQALSPSNQPLNPSLILEGGGTVSLLAMQTALAMQCDPVVLVGQDLAFPGRQVYAGGQALQVDEAGRMSLEANDGLYARPEALTTVTGQTGEPLIALKAYQGFIQHFERIARANHDNTKPARLINVSLGGAMLNGYELKPLSDLETCFPQFKPLVADNNESSHGKAVCDTEAAAWQNTGRVLRAKLAQLRACLEKACALHEAVLKLKHPLPEANRELFEFLNGNPFISHFLLFEMMETHYRYDSEATSTESIQQNQQLLMTSNTHCLAILRDQILPWVIAAENRLEASITP